MQIMFLVNPQHLVPRAFGQRAWHCLGPSAETSCLVWPTGKVVCCSSLPEKLFSVFKMQVYASDAELVC